MFIPPGEKIIETRKCRISGENFVITEKDAQMYEQLAPVFAEKKCTIPFPTLCPNERQIRRMMWRNYDHFYKNTCALTGAEVISAYRPGTPYKVTTIESWWSNDWNATDYGTGVDFNRPFFEQFRSLDQRVFHMPLSITKSENSNFTNYSLNNRNCYMCIRVADCENCIHSFLLGRCKFCYDCYDVTESEYLYECIRTIKSYHSFYCTDCENCNDCYFLKDCSGCRDCFGSCNLKNGQYVMNNEQMTEDEYKRKLQNIVGNLSDASHIRKSFLHYAEKFPKRYLSGFRNENVTGNFLFLSANVVYGFDLFESENMRYCYGSHNGRDCIDLSFGYFQQKCMESCGIANGYNIHFSLSCYNESRDLLYCKDCMSGTTDSFGCISLKKGKYAILNKNYSQQEYEKLATKLIDHMRSTSEWGEYFPTEFSPFAYNESAAQTHFPREKNFVESRGWLWYEPETIHNKADFSALPINQYDEKNVGYEIAQKNIQSLLEHTLTCTETGKNFKIIPQELSFYIENHLPIPTKHPSVRSDVRKAQALPPELYDRTCDECGQPFLTSYAPERPEKILCEECYRKLVY